MNNSNETTDANSSITKEKWFVTSLARGLLVIQAFDREMPCMTLSDVATKTGLDRATARRSLLTLRALGFVKSDGKYFELAPKTLGLGYSYLASRRFDEIAQPVLNDLTKIVGEPSSVSILDGTEVVFVVRSDVSRRRMSELITIGTRLPAYVVASGRTMLAYLPEHEVESLLRRMDLVAFTKRTLTDPEKLKIAIQKVRVEGYCIIDQELEPGLRAVAVPITNAAGKVEAAINVGIQSARMTKRQIVQEILPEMKLAAEAISQSFIDMNQLA